MEGKSLERKEGFELAFQFCFCPVSITVLTLAAELTLWKLPGICLKRYLRPRTQVNVWVAPSQNFTSQVGGGSPRANVWGELACSRIWMKSRASFQLWFSGLDPMAFLTCFPSPFRVNCIMQWHLGILAVIILTPGLLNAVYGDLSSRSSS